MQMNLTTRKVEGLPNGHIIEYSGKFADGRFFVIHRPEKDWGYESFRAAIGSADDLSQVVVKGVDRFRDGGSTIVETKEGVFYFPALHKEEKDTFNNMAIEERYDK